MAISIKYGESTLKNLVQSRVDKKIPVVFGSKSSRTNGKVIYVADLPDSADPDVRLVAETHAYHEAQHVAELEILKAQGKVSNLEGQIKLATAKYPKKYQGLAANVNNALEDLRIDTKVNEKYPGTIQKYHDADAFYLGKPSTIQGWKQLDPVRKSIMTLMIRVRNKYFEEHCTKPVPYPTSAEDEKKYDELLGDYEDAACNVKTYEDVVKLTHEVVDHLIQLTIPPPPPPPKEEEKKDESKSEDDNEEGEEADGEDNGASGSDSDGKECGDNDEEAGQGDGEGSSDSSGNSEGDTEEFSKGSEGSGEEAGGNDDASDRTRSDSKEDSSDDSKGNSGEQGDETSDSGGKERDSGNNESGNDEADTSDGDAEGLSDGSEEVLEDTQQSEDASSSPKGDGTGAGGSEVSGIPPHKVEDKDSKEPEEGADGEGDESSGDDEGHSDGDGESESDDGEDSSNQHEDPGSSSEDDVNDSKEGGEESDQSDGVSDETGGDSEETSPDDSEGSPGEQGDETSNTNGEDRDSGGSGSGSGENDTSDGSDGDSSEGGKVIPDGIPEAGSAEEVYVENGSGTGGLETPKDPLLKPWDIKFQSELDYQGDKEELINQEAQEYLTVNDNSIFDLGVSKDIHGTNWAKEGQKYTSGTETKLRQLFFDERADKIYKGLRSGKRLSSSHLHRIRDMKLGKDPHVWQTRMKGKNIDTAVYFSLDESGSMSGTAWLETIKIASAIAKVLDSVNVKYKIEGWSSRGYSTASATGAEVRAYNEWGQRLNSRRIPDYPLDKSTPSPAGMYRALAQLSTRTEVRKILLFFTDGSPDQGKRAVQYMAEKVKKARSQNMFCFGFGVGIHEYAATDNNMKAIFGKDWVRLTYFDPKHSRENAKSILTKLKQTLGVC